MGLACWLAGPVEAAPPAAPAGRPFKIFMVLWRGETQTEVGFRDYLAEQNVPVQYIVRNINLTPAVLPEVVKEIKAAKPDLVYTWGSTVTLGIAGTYDAGQPDRYVTDIPLVFTTVTDPVGAKLVPSFGSPRRNVTGTSHMAPIEAQLKSIAAYSPFHRLGNIYNPAEVNSVLYAKEIEAYARSHQIEMVNMTVPLDERGLPMAARLPEVLEQMAKANVDFVYLGPDSFIGSQAKLFTDTAIRDHLKVFASTEQPLRNGHALFGLISPYYSLGRLTAAKAKEILVDHKSPQDIPVEVLSRFSYVVNMSVARQLGAYPPMPVVRYADVLND